MKVNALMMDETDNVVTCVTEVAKGEDVVYQKGSELLTLRAEEDIPYCHKIALTDLAEGAEVLKYGELIGKTKRPASVRDLPMTARLADACAAYSRTRKGGRCFVENTRDGSPLRMQNVRRWWERNRDALGAPGIVPYELRHSNLTKMARFMSVFDLQRWAGWSSIGPAKVYVHADMDSLEAAVRRSQIAPVVHRDVIGRTKNAPAEEKGQTA